MRSAISSAMFSALWAGLTACGASTSNSTEIGGPCDANNKCGDGQICDRTDPDGQKCVDASGDMDGDGIPNGKDFCQHKAGGASDEDDEDGDGFGDNCDACPIAAPLSADSDGDALATPCDPDTRAPGDRILLFNGFNAAVSGASAQWKFQNGEAIMTPTDQNIVPLALPLATGTNHITIFTAYQIDGASTTATIADAGVGSKANLPFDKTFVQCGGSRPAPGMDQVLVQQTDSDGGLLQAGKAITTAFDPAVKYRVVQQLDGATANCAIASASMANSGATQLSINGSTPGQAVLYARGATVRFQYILVVGQ